MQNITMKISKINKKYALVEILKINKQKILEISEMENSRIIIDDGITNFFEDRELILAEGEFKTPFVMKVKNINDLNKLVDEVNQIK